MFSYHSFLLEKSTLPMLGVPNKVTTYIHKQFGLDPNTVWKEYYKKPKIKNKLQFKPSLFIQIGNEEIVMFQSKEESDNLLHYYVDIYKLQGEDWGGEWSKQDRRETSITNLMNYIVDTKNKIWKLTDGNYSTDDYNTRMQNKESEEFEDFTVDFKINLIKNFNALIRSSFGLKSNQVKDIILKNLANINKQLSLDDIKKILKSNVKKIKEFENETEKEDPYELKNIQLNENSLTIFDEYIIKFEEKYSDYLGELIFIKELVDKFGMQKIIRSFIYFLYNGKIIKY